MNRTLGELVRECTKRGIVLDNGAKYTRQDLIDKLAKYHYDLLPADKKTWALDYRLSIQTPMLCFNFKDLKPLEQKAMLTSKRYIAERKWNGNRQLVIYHPAEGFAFYSRNISVEDYLPVEYTDKVLIKSGAFFKKPEDFKGVFKVPFVIDTEVVTDSKTIDTTIFSKYGVVTGSELNAVSAILSINAEASRQIQMEQAPLKFMVFDVLFAGNKDIRDLPLFERIGYKEKIVNHLAGTELAFHNSEYVIEDKKVLFEKVLSEGGEGLVLKNLDQPYISTSSRSRKTQIKWKKRVSDSMATDLDAFITGFVAADEDKSWADYIGALELSVFLTDKHGNERIHQIAAISGLPLELRKQMSEKDLNGLPTLKKEYYGKVLTVNGQSVTSKSKRLAHATIGEQGWVFRTDKDKFQCLMTEAELDSMIM